MSKEINTGGPAFPGQYVKHKSGEVGNAMPIIEHSSGMELRDWFAGMALQGLISGCFAGNNQGFTVQGNVVAAYEYADVMLAARGTHE